MDNLSAIVLATGALGTAAFGIVEALKRWRRLGEAGFPAVLRLLSPIFVTLATAYGRDVEKVLRAQYRGERGELTRVIRQGARIGLTPDNAERVAAGLGMVEPEHLKAAALAIKAGQELPADLRNVIGRFELAVDARIDAALCLAADDYAVPRNRGLRRRDYYCPRRWRPPRPHLRSGPRGYRRGSPGSDCKRRGERPEIGNRSASTEVVIYLLDLRANDAGGAVVPGLVVPAPGLGTETQLRAETTVTFLVHGFNVNRREGRDGLLRFAASLTAGAAGAYVAVLWPGDHWTGAASYSFEGTDADDSARALTRYIGDVLTRGSQLAFVSHSLGARVVMETVKRLRKEDYTVRQVCLLAAAIDDFSLAHQANYLSAVPRAQRVAVLASRSDRVLKFAYPAGDLLQAFSFFRRDSVGLALGYHGPKKSGANAVPTQVLHVQIPDGRSADHGHYLPADPPTLNQRSSVTFATEVLTGAVQPHYPETDGH